MPKVVTTLDASDEFLKERVMNLPQAEVEGTHNTEEGKACVPSIAVALLSITQCIDFKPRLDRFRDLNVEDVTVLNYFDELEIHPEHVG